MGKFGVRVLGKVRIQRGLGALLLLLAPLVMGAQQCGSAEQDRVIQLVNAERARAGLPALTMNATLNLDADGWASHLASTTQLAHSNGRGYTWERIGGGENVGKGSSIDEVHVAYMNSAPHRAAILNPSFRFVGAGHEIGVDGRVYTVIQFTFTDPHR